MAKILVVNGKFVVTTYGGFTMATPPVPVYSIAVNISNGTYGGDRYIKQGEQATVTIAPAEHYLAPDSVQITNADLVSYTKSTGVVVINNPVGGVTIKADCIHEPYAISCSIENGSYQGDQKIAAGGTAVVTITPNTGYTYPEDVTVVGATKSYDASTGTVSLSAPTGAVSISGTCAENGLAAPSISLSGDTLSIVDNDGNATSFDIYVDGEYKTNVAKSS